jgi:hypothetical protein
VSVADRTARDLRRRILDTPDARIVTTRDELLAQLDANGSTPDPEVLEADRLAQAVLVHHGIEARPPLPDAEPGQEIDLRVSQRFAIQGAIAVAVAALVVGYAGRPLYGLILVLAAGTGIALLATRGASVDRAVPGWLPRGRMLGVLVAAVPVVLAGLLVVVPLRSHYANQGSPGAATVLVREADAAIDRGDFASAKAKLFAAEANDENPPAIDDVRAHLVVAQVQAIVADAARNDAVYAAAERAFRAGRRARAIALMRSISGWKDADARARAFRRGSAG